MSLAPHRRLAAAVAFGIALAAVFLFTALFRFQALGGGFPNDHFLYLANAQQMLFGEWPTRDFLDPGLPLMYVASALAEVLLGRTLLAEAVLVSLGFALAAVLTAATVRELTGSRVLAVAAALLEVAMVPRSYGYPKLLVYAAGFYLLQRYVTRPTTGRLLAFAASVVVAFLFRHDHGFYLGVGAVVAVWVVQGPPGRIRRVGTLVGAIALLTAPYLAYVQIYGGLWTYLQTGLEFRSRELERQPASWPSLSGDELPQAAMLAVYWALPVLAALLLLVYRRRDDARVLVARVAPIVVVALLVNRAFLRTPFATRLQDAIAPAVVLCAWLMVCAWRSRSWPWVWRPVALLLLALFTTSVVMVGQTREYLGRAGMLVKWTRQREFVPETAARLRHPHHEKQLPSRASRGLLPFYDYVARCTTPDHRLLIAGEIQEVLFFTQRAFAGGAAGFVEGYFESEAYQQTFLRKLRREAVPFVLIHSSAYTRGFEEAFPLLAGYLRARYTTLATFPDGDTGVEVLVDGAIAVPHRDAETGWPCLR